MPAPAGYPMDDIAFTGLNARVSSHRVGVDEAITASDCITDDDAVRGRPGSRSALATTISGSGVVQHAGRFRPSSNCARTVVVRGGHVYIVTDPSTETASDGSVHDLGLPGTSLGLAANWSTSANICGAPMNNNYYLATDQGVNLGVRIVWDGLGCADSNFSLDSLAGIAAGAQPSASLSGTSWTLYRGKTFTDHNISRANDSGTSTWVIATPSDPDNYTYLDYGAAQDWSNADWVAFGVAPHDGGDSDVAVYVSPDHINWILLGNTRDITTDGVNGAPDILYCDLTNIAASDRSAIRYTKFVAEGVISSHPFGLYGHLLIPNAPVNNPESYVVTFYNTATLDESKPTPVLLVPIATGILPYYDLRFYDRDNFDGTGTFSPIISTNVRIYNRQAAIAMPVASDVGQVVTITGTAPALIGAGPFQARLWKLTETGYRLVSVATVTTGGSYTIVDYGGVSVLASQLLQQGGSMPALNALTSHAQRLVGFGTGIEAHKVYISSFTPTDQATASVNPVPQWPDLPNGDADGWSFYIAPSPTEFGLVLNGEGDAVYMSTNECTRAMADLTPGSSPYLVMRKGATSRRGGIFIEDRYVWASWDGVYQAVGMTQVTELSEAIRTFYQDTHNPNCYTCIGYNQRERAIYVYSDNRMVRYWVPGRRWHSGTMSKRIRHCLSWSDQGL